MRILVCCKLTPVWEKVLERDWRRFAPDTDIAYAGTAINCFDESALELALRVKDAAVLRGEKATCAAVTVAPELPAFVAQGLYAAGFDEVTLLEQEHTEFCPEHTAKRLGDYAKTRGFDLILTGAAAGMADTGTVPILLAEKLGLNALCDAEDVRLTDGGVEAICRAPGGAIRCRAALPLIVSVGNSPAVLRAVNLRARLACRDKAAAVEAEAEAGTDCPTPALSAAGGARTCRMLAPEDAARAVLEAFSADAGGAEPTRGRDVLPDGTVCCEIDACPPFAYEAVTERILSDTRTANARLLLLPDTGFGRLVAARLADKLGRPFIAGVTFLRRDEEAWFIESRACAGNLIWTKPLWLPAVVSVRTRLREADAVVFNADAAPPAWIMDWERLPEAMGLERAEKLVVCGAGMGSAAACNSARLLARRLYAGFGLTRPAALNGFGAAGEIVGQSGVIASPRACLVLGASGAAAFLAGVEAAGRIIAVNTDPAAPVFRRADVGVRADANAFVRRLLELLPRGEGAFD